MSLRVRVAREINYQYENERKQWGVDMKQYRLKHKQEFWNTQTQAENFAIIKFQTERH